MPIYEYRCEDCRRTTSHLILSKEDPPPACRYCGGMRLTRLLSRVAFVRSEEDRLERLADPTRLGDLDENDPRSMARWMKRMGQEMGEDMGDDFDQLVDESVEEAAGADEEML